MKLFPIFATACLLASTVVHADEAASPHTESAFLAALDGTPVRWQTWNSQPTRAAAEADRPLFFFVGHFGNGLARAMIHETFANQTIAALLNEKAVPVAVDINANPELAAFLGQLGFDHFSVEDWPLCLWTDSDLAPLTGGGYFPPTDDWGSQGFLTLARNLTEQWTLRREELLTAAQARLQGTLDTVPLSASDEALDRALEAAQRPQEDAQSLQAAQLFAISQALTEVPDTQASELAAHLAQRIETIVSTAGFDAIDGGFFVGANDREWKLPLFQKSTTDQALMVGALARAKRAGHDRPRYEDVIRLTLDFVERKLLKENGLAIQYLDSFAPGESMSDREGSYYLFTPEDIADLPEEIRGIWSLSPEGNVDSAVDVLGLYEGVNIPYNTAADALSAAREAARDALRAVRESKPQPAADRTAYLATNALLVGAYAQAAQAIENASYAERAEALFQSMKEHCYSPEGWRNDDLSGSSASGAAHDQLANALLDLFAATGDQQYLKEAEDLASNASLELAAFEAIPGLRKRIEEAGLSTVDQLDRRAPSALSVRVASQARLAKATGGTSHSESAAGMLERVFRSARDEPLHSLALHVAAAQLRRETD